MSAFERTLKYSTSYRILPRTNCVLCACILQELEMYSWPELSGCQMYRPISKTIAWFFYHLIITSGKCRPIWTFVHWPISKENLYVTYPLERFLTSLQPHTGITTPLPSLKYVSQNATDWNNISQPDMWPPTCMRRTWQSCENWPTFATVIITVIRLLRHTVHLLHEVLLASTPILYLQTTALMKLRNKNHKSKGRRSKQQRIFAQKCYKI